jgi:hypothetical protein
LHSLQKIDGTDHKIMTGESQAKRMREMDMEYKDHTDKNDSMIFGIE